VSIIERIIDLLLGMFAGTYGTLIGAGGGFIMSPILLLFFGKAPQVAAATSLTAVVFNAAMAVITYHQQGRIDYFTGIRFALATIPGALLGSILVNYLPGAIFKLFFGVVLILIAGYMAMRGERPAGRAAGLIADEARLRAEGKTVRVLIDRTGAKTIFGYRMRDGLLLSSLVGVLSSLLGVGGGIIHTPMMIGLFGIPAHIAVATSQFILLISAVTGTASFLAQGLVDIPTAVALGLGGIVGARLGATIARRLKGKLIVRLLAVALLLVGGRLIWAGLGL
jgi:uncharacterized membrane protein YfcA